MPRKPKKPVTSILAKNIKRLRDAHGWTQRHLAELIGHEEPAHISQMERGIRGAGVDIRKKLCDVFEVEEGELFRSESEWGVTRETVRVLGETAPGSYGVPDLSKHRAVEMVAPTREDARKRLVGQLDKILDNPEQSIVRAITANLEAFATVAEHTAEIAALRKELDELKMQNKILLAEIAKSRRPESKPERRESYKAIKQLIETTDGGQP